MNFILRPVFFKKILFSLSLGFLSLSASAQLPVCLSANTGYAYLQTGSSIWNYDPTLPLSATNPFLNTITLPAGSGGLAVSSNVNAPTPSPTFYTTVGGNYWYYNGTVWVNTGHSVGNAAAVNPGAGGGFIYNLVGGTGQVYKYDGTGNGTLVATVAGFAGGGPYDLVGDCAGNWYILCTSPLTNQYLRKYNSAGVLLQSWTLTGAPSTGAGGLAIIGNTLYYHNNTPNFITGTIGATTVTITNIAPGLAATFSPQDMASCELGGIVAPKKDSVYYCGTGPGVALNASGTGPYTWSVLSGPAVITGSGATVTVTATNTSVILSTSAGSASLCNAGGVADTFVVIVPKATINAGADDSTFGCAVYLDTLHGQMFNTTPGITYGLAWTPIGSIVSGGNTLNPIIAPTANTPFVFTVSTPANKGGCTWKDTVNIYVVDKSVTADFSFTTNWGCSEDTIHFTNLSTGYTPIHIWDFFDNTGDTALNPVHIYTTQAAHSTRLIVSNGYCKDSVTKTVDTDHPLDASFTVDDDSACQQQLVNFTNTSLTTVKNGINPEYSWDFGDGATSTLQNPSHAYTVAGTYVARLIVKDFVPCYDTAYHTIVIDSIPFVFFTLTDSVLCEGQGSLFTAHFLDIGNTGFFWQFGDSTTIYNINPVSHAFDAPGIYTVKLTSQYRLCPDTSYSRDVTIKPFPAINLGRDTVLCPYGQPIELRDWANANNPIPGATYLWSTGEVTPAIMVNSIGTFWATLDVGGCTTSDSVNVDKDCYIDLPNSFTPNGDGLNDYFFPRQLLSRSVDHFKMTIYNRWGQVIFETTNINGRGWDGRFNDQPQPQSVFVYLVDVAFKNGVKEHYQGNVTLLR